MISLQLLTAARPAQRGNPYRRGWHEFEPDVASEIRPRSSIFPGEKVPAPRHVLAGPGASRDQCHNRQHQPQNVPGHHEVIVTSRDAGWEAKVK